MQSLLPLLLPPPLLLPLPRHRHCRRRRRRLISAPLRCSFGFERGVSTTSDDFEPRAVAYKAGLQLRFVILEVRNLRLIRTDIIFLILEAVVHQFIKIINNESITKSESLG